MVTHILNEHWPPRPDQLAEQDPIRVVARIVLEDVGETWIQGDAISWDAGHTRVRLADYGDIWLKPADVFRNPSDRDLGSHVQSGREGIAKRGTNAQ